MLLAIDIGNTHIKFGLFTGSRLDHKVRLATDQGRTEDEYGVLLVQALGGLLAQRDFDLLFIGSRGYGPLRAVMVGGVSGRLVREAACLVVVFPRSAGVDGGPSPRA